MMKHQVIRSLLYFLAVLPVFTQAQGQNLDYTNICVAELEFGGEEGIQYLSIMKDDGSGVYTKPHFKKNCSTDVVTIDHPVAYVSGTKIRLKAKLEVFCLNSVWVKAVGPDGIEFPVQEIFVGTTGVIDYGQYESTIPFEALKVKHYDPFRIEWRIDVSPSGSFSKVADVTEATIYVTHKAPIDAIPGVDDTSEKYRSGIGYEWFESLFYISCEGSNGAIQKTTITEGIWNQFTNNDMERKDGTSLNYYFHWDLPFHSTTTAYLLQNRDGQCYAWCSFFIDLLKIQGINQADDIVLLESNDDDHPIFLVNDWEFNTPNLLTPFIPPACSLNSPYSIIGRLGSDWVQNIGNNYYYDFYYQEINDVMGVVGQNASNPESIFMQHCLVYLDHMGKFYDPSYGTAYSTIEDWREGSVNGWGCFPALWYEESYDDFDPNNTILDNYDFNGDGDLSDPVHHIGFSNNKHTSDFITIIYDR